MKNRVAADVKILLVGGGSGGHITPLLAVAKQLKIDQPKSILATVSERRSRFDIIFGDSECFDKSYKIWAGKFRRYHNESFIKRVTDIRTILLNIRDLLLIIVGFLESIILLARFKPDLVFIKGGYVGVPIGFAAWLLRIPYITHDSDATSGLTNRIIGSKARVNAVGMPSDLYEYDKSKIQFTGVPIQSAYLHSKSINTEDFYSRFSFPFSARVLLVLGGSNGAQRLDQIVHRVMKELLEKNKDLFVLHQVGLDNEAIYEEFDDDLKKRIETMRFIDPLAPAIKAADVIVSRAGSTTIAEIAALKKAAIFLPHPELSGGHQLENARILKKADAAIVLDEKSALESPNILGKAINQLLTSSSNKSRMGDNLSKLIPSDGAKRVSRIIINTIESKAR